MRIRALAVALSCATLPVGGARAQTQAPATVGLAPEPIVAAPAEAAAPLEAEPAVTEEVAPVVDDGTSPFALHLGADVGFHTVLNTWPLFEPGVAMGTGRSSEMYSLRISGSLARWPKVRAELGLAILPFQSTIDRDNTALHYALDVFYVARQWTRSFAGGDWTPQAGGGLGLYHNVRGDLGADADPTLHAALGLRGDYGRYGLRVTMRDYVTDWIAGEGPGNNLELSVGLEVFTGYVPPDPVAPVAAPIREVVVVPAAPQPAPSAEPLEGGDRPLLTVEEKRRRDEATARIQGTVLRFSIGSSILIPEHDVLLQQVAEQLRQHRWVRLVVVGFADALGHEATNVTLSQARAEVVLDRLSQLGVDRNRLLAVAAGEKNPFAANESEVGRIENRRVELHVLSQ